MKAGVGSAATEVRSMEELFRDFWWLIFPLAWILIGGLTPMLNYRRQKDTMKLIQAYVDRGQEPPEALLKLLDRPLDEDAAGMWQAASAPGVPGGGRGGLWFTVVLFAILSAGFGYAAWTDMYGAGQAFLIVAFVMGAVAAAMLVSALVTRRR
jgi:hypothetical protein